MAPENSLVILNWENSLRLLLMWKQNTAFIVLNSVVILALLHYINFQYTYEDDGEGNSLITLEVLSDISQTENFDQTDLTNEAQQLTGETQEAVGVHFETENPKIESTRNDTSDSKESDHVNISKARTDLLEYMTRNDGSVICKLCGEILQSRTHWYRHKYKIHVMQPLNPAPLFQCEQCLVFFKSRKGFNGHVASRHSEVLSDSSPVSTNSQTEALDKQVQTQSEMKDGTDPELAIPKSSLPNYQSVAKQSTKQLDSKRQCKNNKDQQNTADWEEQRTREEKLVADIIDRVRRECEAQGSGPARRGYTRRTTVMHT
ncbi:unnamed protein product [Parnassius apollo]|uniref:(apollo) hypothetical protein n=1 Tax=Parnassius apollo TaxID=110799 RepID=A0A8S3WJE6_PARAO|nr:unnamed protein product [Parnassius apollo]